MATEAFSDFVVGHGELWCCACCDSRAPAQPCFLCAAAGMATEAFSDFVVGHGELWCALLFCAACRVQAGDAAFMDTREVLVVSRCRV